MRAAVYNRYWGTGGGAEKYGGAIAQLLARDAAVDIVGHDAVDLDWLGERLQLDLSGIRVRELDDVSGAVTEASADYDLFCNVSFMSSDRAATARSLYVVHFPTSTEAHLPGYKRVVARRLGSLRDSLISGMEWGTGFYHREAGRRAPIWTNGDAVLRFTTAPGRAVPVELVFSHHRPPSLPPAQVRIEVDGETAAELELGPARSRAHALRGTPVRVRVRSAREDQPVEVRIISDTFVPSDVSGGSDNRRLGVSLLGLHPGEGAATALARVFPVLLTPPVSTTWTRTYGAVVANSEFTRHWIAEWWDIDSEVLYPPVTMIPPGGKEPTILNVGRFFPADGGHSKKQLALVEAFRTLCDAGVRGWALHLVGGCAADGEPYLEQVRDRARGYPVEIHANVPGEQLAQLYRSASIYWHASGHGENAERRPDRLEHFGITTVEAMSAGAVPVVIGLAGQLETVRHGVDGFHFRTLDGLADMTRLLIDDDRLRADMSRSAIARARAFSMEAFDDRLSAVVERVMAGGEGDGEPRADGAPATSGAR
jgi:glycosyltransferase involved in cell wall biosynthesis